jgi:endonuclease-3
MKKEYDIPDMLKRIEKAVAPFPKAAMFKLYEQGYRSLFEQLISCLISIRTLDEITIPTSIKLFAKARKPKDILKHIGTLHLPYCSTSPCFNAVGR